MALFKFVFLEALVEFEPNTEPELSTRDSHFNQCTTTTLNHFAAISPP